MRQEGRFVADVAGRSPEEGTGKVLPIIVVTQPPDPAGWERRPRRYWWIVPLAIFLFLCIGGCVLMAAGQ